jgi:Family of unknown function (DUF6788)
MKERMRALRAQIKSIKRELAELEVLRPGSLSRQFNVCGSPGCRCKASPPQKHGPYYHLSHTRNGKGGTRSIDKDDVPTIRAALANYARLRNLVDRWIDLATELSDLEIQLRHPVPKASKRGMITLENSALSSHLLHFEHRRKVEVVAARPGGRERGLIGRIQAL